MTETEIPADIMQAAHSVMLTQAPEGGLPRVDWYALRREVASALLAERRRHTVEAQPVPEGWQLVPTEITTDMMGAFHHAKRVEKFVPDIWSAMLAAAPTPPSRAEVTPAGMRMGDELLRKFYEKGLSIRRKSWPAGDHIDTDGAEGGTIWYYRAEDDELTPGYRLDFHDLGAGDWEFLPRDDEAQS